MLSTTLLSTTLNLARSSVSLILLVTVSVLLLGGCASTKKRFEKGVKLEEKGQYRQAVNYYLQVLQKEPEYPEAKDRLLDVATKVVQEDWATANDYDAAGQSLSAYERYRSIDNLIASCQSVGVFVAEPGDLVDRLERSEEEAFNELLLRAEHSANEGKFDRAIDEYARARNWPNVTPEREYEIDEAVARVHLAWARSEFDREKYGAAFDHAAATIEIVGIDHQLGLVAEELQANALAEGTRLVAFLALGATDEVARSAPRLFQDDLNDVMLYDFWSQPPPFIATADPIVVRRELRRVAGRGTRILTRTDAIEIGRAVDVDYVLAGEITRFDVADKKVKETTRSVKTRGRNAQDTTYVLRKYTQEQSVKVAYRIYDIRRRNQMDQGSVSSKQSQEMERGLYAGDYNDLDLSGSEFALFDPQELQLQEQALHERLSDDLARKLADEVYSRILNGLR